MILRNWKTTAAGVVAILGGVIAAIQLATGDLPPEQAWPIITAAWAAGLGLFAARDDGTPGPSPDAPEPFSDPDRRD